MKEMNKPPRRKRAGY